MTKKNSPTEVILVLRNTRSELCVGWIEVDPLHLVNI